MELRTNELAGTARTTAAKRARESERPDALLRDPWARALAEDEALGRLSALPVAVRDNPYTAIRTRVFDDWLTSVTACPQGLRQVVMLGAGMDTRAFRLSWSPDVQLWEVDQPQVIELKETVLAQEAPAAVCARRTVALDLSGDDLMHRLVGANFRPEVPTAWLAEGLLPYLRPGAAEHLLTMVTQLSALGSRLAADLVGEDFVNARNAYLQRLAERGIPQRGAQFYFGTNDPGEWLSHYSWRAEWVKEPGDEGASFGRWSLPAIPREAPGYPRFFLVAAVCA